MFCKHCGTQLADGSSFCTNCGQQLNAPAAPQAAPVATATKSGTDVMGYLKKAWEYVQSMFKKDPADAMLAAYQEKTPIWYALIGGAFLLSFGCIMAMIQALGNMEIMGGESINSLLSAAKKVFDKLPKAVRKEMGDVPGSLLGAVGFFKVLLFSLIIYVGTVGAKAVGTWVCATKVAKNDVALPSVLNLIGMSELPVVAGCVLATVGAFIWYPLGIVFLLAGAAASAVMHIEAVKATGILGQKSAWMMAVLSIIVNLVFVALMYWAVNAWAEGLMEGLGSVMGGMIGGVGDLLGGGLGDLGDLGDLLG